MIYTPLGTTIQGTHRAADLIPAFCDELETCMAEHNWQGMTDKAQAFAEYHKLIADAKANIESDESSDFVSDLMDALGDFAAPYSYFGAHEGDGSDFGFWPYVDTESLQDAAESGYRVVISDHGNVTLYDGNDVEVWGVV